MNITSKSQIKVGISGSSGFLGTNTWMALEELSNLKLFSIDFRNTNSFHTIKNLDFLFHFGSGVKPVTFLSDSKLVTQELNDFNNILDFLKLSNPRLIHIYPSTCSSVYDLSVEPQTELTPSVINSPYARFKMHMENLIRLKTNRYLILRLSNIYGFGQRANQGQGVFSEWLNCMKDSKPRYIFGNLDDTRDYLYIDDFQTAISALIQKKDSFSFDHNNIFNVCSNNSYSLNQIIETFDRIFPNELESLYQSRSDIDGFRSNPSSKFFMSTFSWFPKYDLYSGLVSLKDRLFRS